MNSKIGIVIPIGRFSHSLETTIISLIEQKQNIKIAVYDASGDERTKALLEAYREHFNFVHYGPDGGQSNAILMGWKHLNTDIVGWLNDDDNLAPNTFTHVLDIFNKKSNCVGVFGPSVILDENGVYSGMHPEVNPERLNEVSFNNIISQPSCFVQYEKVKQIGGINKTLEYTMDWDLWVRLLSSSPNSFIFSKQILSAVIFAQDTKTAQISFKRLREIYRVTNRYNPISRSIVTVFSYLKLGVLQRLRTQRPDFYRSQMNEYSYWNYSKNISGVSIFGDLTSSDIERLELEYNAIHQPSKYQRVDLKFKKIIPPGNIITVNLKDINYNRIEFHLDG